MAEPNSSSSSPSPKLVKPSSPHLPTSPPSPASKKGMKTAGQLQPYNLKTEHRGQMKEQAFVKKFQELNAVEEKYRVRVAQGLPVTTDKPQVLPKPYVKEQTKPLNIKLHTQQRAARRAGYNYLVANKINSLELLKKFEEKIQKVIDEEEIKMMRKEMVPRAQLMPIFDRPFLPQRSSRPLTVPKEPSFLSRKCFNGYDHFRFQQYSLHQNMKAIK